MNIVQKTVSSLGIILVPVLVTRAVASPKPTLPQVVENTYLAPYQQTRTTTLQTVTYGYTTSTISGTSVTDSAVVNSKFTQVVDMTTTVYGSMSRQKVYVANGVTYFNTGRGWTGGTKNPDAGDWAKTVTRMSTVWKPIYVSNAPGAREFRANDTENSGHKILDSLITQVLLRNHLHLEKKLLRI
jgi:hypothetical protein